MLGGHLQVCPLQFPHLEKSDALVGLDETRNGCRCLAGSCRRDRCGTGVGLLPHARAGCPRPVSPEKITTNQAGAIFTRSHKSAFGILGREACAAQQAGACRSPGGSLIFLNWAGLGWLNIKITIDAHLLRRTATTVSSRK